MIRIYEFRGLNATGDWYMGDRSICFWVTRPKSLVGEIRPWAKGQNKGLWTTLKIGLMWWMAPLHKRGFHPSEWKSLPSEGRLVICVTWAGALGPVPREQVSPLSKPSSSLSLSSPLCWNCQRMGHEAWAAFSPQEKGTSVARLRSVVWQSLLLLYHTCSVDEEEFSNQAHSSFFMT